MSEGKYIDKPAAELLDDFGAGHATPGAGAAGALAGALAAALVWTVADLTIQHRGLNPDYEAFAERAEGIKAEARALEADLRAGVDEDSGAFAKVIEARRARDAAKKADDHEGAAHHTAEEQRYLVPATELPMRFADRAIRVARLGGELLEHGFKSARGDVGVAIAVALAAVEGNLGTAALNLVKLKDLEKASAWRAEADALLGEVATCRAAAAEPFKAMLDKVPLPEA